MTLNKLVLINCVFRYASVLFWHCSILITLSYTLNFTYKNTNVQPSRWPIRYLHANIRDIQTEPLGIQLTKTVYNVTSTGQFSGVHS